MSSRSPSTATTACSDSAGSPDLVLLDVFMPRKSGIAALKELLSLDATVPVIVMSGGAPNPAAAKAPAVDHRELAQLLGAVDTIAKPFRAAELGAIVQRHLAPRSYGQTR